MNRRILTLGLLLAALAQGAAPAFADGGSGSSGGGSGSGGSGGGGNSGSGSGNSGSGNSGGGGEDDDEGGDDDWASAADAAERGDIVPLQAIIKVALDRTPGKVLGVSLDHKGSSYVYRVKILATTGRKVEVSVNAVSRAVIKVK